MPHASTKSSSRSTATPGRRNNSLAVFCRSGVRRRPKRIPDRRARPDLRSPLSRRRRLLLGDSRQRASRFPFHFAEDGIRNRHSQSPANIRYFQAGTTKRKNGRNASPDGPTEYAPTSLSPVLRNGGRTDTLVPTHRLGPFPDRSERSRGNIITRSPPRPPATGKR